MPKATAQRIAIVCLVLAGLDIVLGHAQAVFLVER